MALSRVTLRELTAEERQALEQRAASPTAQARFVARAQILLAVADGRRPSQLAQDLGVSRPTVSTWIHRCPDQGLPTAWRIGPGPGGRTPTPPSNALR